MLAVGLMSGTSLDGVDAALVDVSGEGADTKVRLLAFETFPMPAETRERIMRACDPIASSTPLLCSLNAELGHIFADAARAVCVRAGIKVEDLAFVASHGQTVWHEPLPSQPGERGRIFAASYPSTLQIGEPANIAWELGVKVVANFRPMDMAAGGQGAPLVPYSEVVLYGDASRNVALLNVGGIGNITVLPAGCAEGSAGPTMAHGVFAFDTGPGNMMVDEACRRLLGVPYDEGGKIAKSGRVNVALLEQLMATPYLQTEPPKSTGRELFGADATGNILDAWHELPARDVIATLTEFTARCVADACERYVVPRVGMLDRLVVGGGGAHNTTLVDALRRLMPRMEVLTQEELGFSSDAKEAVAFAILGNETLCGAASNVPSATGASCPVVLGSITYPPCEFGKSRW